MLLLVLGVEENMLEWYKPEQISCHHGSNNYRVENSANHVMKRKKKDCIVQPYSLYVCCYRLVGITASLQIVHILVNQTKGIVVHLWNFLAEIEMRSTIPLTCL